MGACAINIQFLCSVLHYHVSEGLNTLQCWCVLPVLIPERQKNQAVTLRSRPVKKHIFFFLQRTDHSKWPPLFFSNNSKHRNRANSAVLNRELKGNWGRGKKEDIASVGGTVSNSTHQCRTFAEKKKFGSSMHRKTARPGTLLLQGNRN